MSNSVDRVIEFVADYKLPLDGSWDQTRDNWKNIAVDAWLAAARERGLAVTVQEIIQDSDDIAFIEVDGQEYTLVHPGRAPEVQAKLR